MNIVEAMLTGTPVVATVNRGHRELIKNGKNGFLIGIDDEKGMQEQVCEILTNEKIAKYVTLNASKSSLRYSCISVMEELAISYYSK